jgi:signal transduction histidine kinase
MFLKYHDEPCSSTDNAHNPTPAQPEAHLLETDWLADWWTLQDWVERIKAELHPQTGVIIHMMDDEDRLPFYWGWHPKTEILEAERALPPALQTNPADEALPLLVQGQWVGQLLLWHATTTQEGSHPHAEAVNHWLAPLALSVQLTRSNAQQQRLRLERLLMMTSLSPHGGESLLTEVLTTLMAHFPASASIIQLLPASTEEALPSTGSTLATNAKPSAPDLTKALTLPTQLVQGQLNPTDPVLWHPLLADKRLLGMLGLQCTHWNDTIRETLTLLSKVLGHRLAEWQHHHATQQKANALAQAINTLQATQLQLVQSEKLAIIGQFVAGIAHEVNTPLAVVSSNNQLLQQQLATQTEWAHVLPLLDLSQLACERMTQTVQNLKRFARLDHTEEKTPVPIWQSLLDTLAIIQPGMPKHVSVTLKPPAHEDALWLNGYGGLLNIVWMNLLVNALHAVSAIPQGNPAMLTLRGWQKDQAVWIQVQDTGCGIPPEIRHRIFDPGFTTKGVGLGSGLGLSLCMQIVQKHGGDVMVQSAEQRGSCFTVKLPLQPVA